MKTRNQMKSGKWRKQDLLLSNISQFSTLWHFKPAMKIMHLILLLLLILGIPDVFSESDCLAQLTDKDMTLLTSKELMDLSSKPMWDYDSW